MGREFKEDRGKGNKGKGSEVKGRELKGDKGNRTDGKGMKKNGMCLMLGGWCLSCTWGQSVINIEGRRS